MEILKLNETPVRTSNNFKINNIKLEDIDIPVVDKEFDNMIISGDAVIDSNVSENNFTYGIGKEFTTMQSNKQLRIFAKNKENIEFTLNESESALVDNIEIIASKDSNSSVLIKYKSEGEECFFHNGNIRVSAESGSNINIVIINLINSKSNSFLSIENHLEENANVKYTIVDFGGKNSITNYYSDLKGNSSENSISTMYLGRDNQLFDLNYIAELRGEKTNIDIEVQGALRDKSKKHFKGTIDFKKGCKKAKGNENEECTLLSDTAKSLALPMLLCSEEDVEGNHSSSAGKIGERELFYIMSRGFTMKEAMKLMVRAKFNKILENLEDEDLVTEIEDEIDSRLN